VKCADGLLPLLPSSARTRAQMTSTIAVRTKKFPIAFFTTPETDLIETSVTAAQF
jgi:hypothetical protein